MYSSQYSLQVVFFLSRTYAVPLTDSYLVVIESLLVVNIQNRRFTKGIQFVLYRTNAVVVEAYNIPHTLFGSLGLVCCSTS